MTNGSISLYSSPVLIQDFKVAPAGSSGYFVVRHKRLGIYRALFADKDAARNKIIEIVSAPRRDFMTEAELDKAIRKLLGPIEVEI